MKEFWEKRYKNQKFAYGEEPNQFFVDVLNNYNLKGTMLLPAEGEGRNAVFAARKGFEVSCFDISNEGKLKALKLANEHNVTINYQVGELSEFNFSLAIFSLLFFITEEP
jgi:2-polyprenyl-3-methyl-5-hydroxy-6-metoxy-1,4-benzoquinol methylase